MTTTETIQRVRIYLTEHDKTNEQLLYMAVLDQLRRAGATGATVLRGVAGFGAGLRLRTSATTSTAALPIIVEWVDRAERIRRVLPLLDELLASALITVEDIQIYRAVLRSEGPFMSQMVGDVLEHDVLVAPPSGSVAQAGRELLARTQALLPVLDEHRRMLGVVSDSNVLRGVLLPGQERAASSAQLPWLPIELLRALPPAERAALLATVPARPVSEVMTQDVHTLAPETPIAQAAGRMVEWGLDVLPVITHEGTFVGLFGIEQVLRAALVLPPAASPIRPADPLPLVRLLMQGLVPTVPVNAPAAEALARLLAAPDRFLVLVDAGRPLGMLTQAMFVGQTSPALRSAWLQALLQPPAQPQRTFEPLLQNQYAIDLPHFSAPTIAAQATRDDAIRALLDQQHAQLVVVEEDGRIAGIIGRRGLLRALAQESAG